MFTLYCIGHVGILYKQIDSKLKPVVPLNVAQKVTRQSHSLNFLFDSFIFITSTCNYSSLVYLLLFIIINIIKIKKIINDDVWLSYRSQEGNMTLFSPVTFHLFTTAPFWEGTVIFEATLLGQLAWWFVLSHNFQLKKIQSC